MKCPLMVFPLLAPQRETRRIIGILATIGSRHPEEEEDLHRPRKRGQTTPISHASQPWRKRKKKVRHRRKGDGS